MLEIFLKELPLMEEQEPFAHAKGSCFFLADYGGNMTKV